MNHLFRAALATAALLVLPHFATAGPIEWDFLQDFRPSQPTPVTDHFIQLGQMTDFLGRPVEIVGFLTGGSPEGPGSGSQRIEIGTLESFHVFTDPVGGPNYAGPRPARWEVTMWITDRASGETAQILAYGRGHYLGDNALNDKRVALEILEGQSHELRLGGNRYQIEFSTTEDSFTNPQGGTDHVSFLWADVAATSATPEPGTLALAGLGLGLVGLRLRRRFTPVRDCETSACA